MTHATGSRAAACVLFNLPDHRVLDAVDLPGGGRRVLIEHVALEAACPTCGTLSGRVHQRTHQRLRDVPIAGAASDLEVVLVRRRFACTEPACPRRTFTDVSDQVPLRARVTTRLRVAVLDAVVRAGRVVAEVATAHAISWWTVQKVVNTPACLSAARLERLMDSTAVLSRAVGGGERDDRARRARRQSLDRWPGPTAATGAGPHRGGRRRRGAVRCVGRDPR